MMVSMKHLWLFLFSLPALGQVPTQSINPCLQQGCYFSTTSVSVGASASTTLTIQQPATGARQVNLIAAVATCPGKSFSVDQSQNGSAATATAGTKVMLWPTTVTAMANVFTASNVGSGTTMAPTLPYQSGSIAVIDLSMRTIGLSGTTNNYSVKLTNTDTASCTGTVSFYWSERI